MSRTYKDTPGWVKGYRKAGKKPPRKYHELTNPKLVFSQHLQYRERWDGKIVSYLPLSFIFTDEYKQWAAKYRRYYPSYRCDCRYCLPNAYSWGYRAHERDMIKLQRYDDIAPHKKFQGRIKSRGC